MKFQLEFTRNVVTRDGYTTQIDEADLAAARAAGDQMASDMNHNCPDGVAEIGPLVCESWELARVIAVPDAPVATGDAAKAADEASTTQAHKALTLPYEVWQGMLRAAESGVSALGTGDRAAIAAVAALKAHVQIKAAAD